MLATLLAAAFTAAAGSGAAETCSRSLSREASLGAGALQRAALAAGVAPAPACPLQPHLGMYAAQEAVKLRKKDKHWVCQACGRAFMGQEWVDGHLRDWHSGAGAVRGLRALPVAGTCLADHCELLGCPGLAAAGGGSSAVEGAAGEAAAHAARCLAVLEGCFPEAAALAAEAGGDGAAQRRRDFFVQQREALCHSTLAQRQRAWAAEDAALRAFHWTPARLAGAAAAVLVFLWLLRAIVLEDIRSPIKGLKERTRERKAEAEAKAAAEAAAGSGEKAQEEEQEEVEKEEEEEVKERVGEGGAAAMGGNLRYRGSK